MKLIAICLLLTLAFAAYDETLSKLTASYSAISHCDQKAIESWSCKLCKNTEALT